MQRAIQKMETHGDGAALLGVVAGSEVVATVTSTSAAGVAGSVMGSSGCVRPASAGVSPVWSVVTPSKAV
jgi:hypothetical protein